MSSDGGGTRPEENAVVGEEEDRLVLCHFNARGAESKEEILKEWFTEKDVACAGIAESHTYLSHGLSDAAWRWEPGKEVQPGPLHRHPPGGVGFFTSTSSKASVIESGEYSVWCRLETKEGIPVFVGECYFPHKSEINKHKQAWNEVEKAVEKPLHLGHIVLMGDFNAKMGMNGDCQVDAAGRLMRKRLNAMRLHAVNGFRQCKGKFTHEQVVKG